MLGYKSTMQRSIADLIGWAVAAYLLYKDAASSHRERIEQAYECLDYIERARAYGVIIPQRLTSNLRECQEQNKKLKELNGKLSRDNIHQKKLIEELHKTINTITAKGLKKAEGK